MTLNDGGTATYNDTLSKNTGTLVFDYMVLPSDTSIKTLGVARAETFRPESLGIPRRG